MAKAKKVVEEDLKKFFEMTKKNLQQLKKETGIWMKKGEAEISRFSRIGKLEFDIANLKIKKEKLFRDIGKRLVESGLIEGIDDSIIKSMREKINTIIKESEEKRSEISKIGGKNFLKNKPTKTKKKK